MNYKLIGNVLVLTGVAVLLVLFGALYSATKELDLITKIGSMAWDWTSLAEINESELRLSEVGLFLIGLGILGLFISSIGAFAKAVISSGIELIRLHKESPNE